MAPTLERVDHIHVFVSDRGAAESWYADVMGLKRINELEFWAADRGPLTIGDRSGAIHLALFEHFTFKFKKIDDKKMKAELTGGRAVTLTRN